MGWGLEVGSTQQQFRGRRGASAPFFLFTRQHTRYVLFFVVGAVVIVVIVVSWVSVFVCFILQKGERRRAGGECGEAVRMEEEQRPLAVRVVHK